MKILRHPFCIKMKHYFYTNGDSPDEVYLNVVMEYVPGQSLAQLLQAQESLPLSEAVSLFLQMASGLTEAHAVSVIHRDIKPSNILLREMAGDID